jgi:hypothetical protein
MDHFTGPRLYDIAQFELFVALGQTPMWTLVEK